MFVVQFSLNFRYTYILTLGISLCCQKWIITESESLKLNFPMYRHNGPRPCLQSSTTVLCDIIMSSDYTSGKRVPLRYHTAHVQLTDMQRYIHKLLIF